MKSARSLGTIGDICWATRLLLLVFACVMIVGAPAICKTPNFQYANIAPLPGGGIAIDKAGRPDGQGALQINIPVAYTPGWGYASLGVFKGKHPYTGSDEFGNGSGIFALGFFNKRRTYMSGMQVSRLSNEAKALSGQVSLADETLTTPALAVGVQDILGKERNGRSIYLVATKGVKIGNREAFATLGFGTERFLDGPFGGISLPLSSSLNVVAEWDGYQINGGFGWRPSGRHGNLTILGAVNGQAGWLLGASLAYNFMP